MKKFISVLLLGLFVQQSAFAAWPSLSARSKDWGTETLTDSDLEGQFDLLHTYNNDSLNASTGHKHQGTTNDGPKIPINSSLTIASQAAGDIIYASSSSAWARLAKGTALQGLRMNSGATAPEWATINTNAQYRQEMNVMQASTTTMTVGPGSVEINGSLVSKTSNTTLTLTTAGNWAGGSSQQATNTTGYVIIDSSGNIKMTTTAPTHADYGVSITAANNTKRYATVSGTVYRYLGWFRMNGTGSGELDTYGVSNILDVGVRNSVRFETGATATTTTVMPIDDTIPQNTEGGQFMSIIFVPTNVNNVLKIDVTFFGGEASDFANAWGVALFQDATAGALAAGASTSATGTYLFPNSVNFTHYMKAATTSTTTFYVRAGAADAGTFTFNGGNGRTFGGVMASSISVEEIPAQLT